MARLQEEEDRIEGEAAQLRGANSDAVAAGERAIAALRDALGQLPL